MAHYALIHNGNIRKNYAGIGYTVVTFTAGSGNVSWA